MRIAYITFERSCSTSGIGKKITFQINEWLQTGHEVIHFILNHDDHSAATLECQYIFQKSNFPPMVSAVRYQNVLRKRLLDYSPDIIYIRQMLWWPGLVATLKGFKVVQEINSDIEEEYRLLKGLSSLKYNIYQLSKNFLPKIIKGNVFVSHELSVKYPMAEVPHCIIGNGYQFSDLPHETKPSTQRPQLIFVGSGGQPWHGIDKILDLANLLPEMDFHLVTQEEVVADIPNMIFHGHVHSEDLARLYKRMHFGVGTLALYRKGMNEASPLKTREYAAYGLPIIAGYEDTDLSQAPYYLNIGNHKNNVKDSVAQIRAFVSDWMKRPFPFSDARILLSTATKESTRLSFFRRVLDEQA